MPASGSSVLKQEDNNIMAVPPPINRQHGLSCNPSFKGDTRQHCLAQTDASAASTATEFCVQCDEACWLMHGTDCIMRGQCTCCVLERPKFSAGMPRKTNGALMAQ